MLKTNLKTETAKDRLTRMALSNSGAGASPSVPAPAVMPQTASSGNTAKERLAKLAAQNSASGVYSMERPTVNVFKVNTPAATAPKTDASKTETAKQTTATETEFDPVTGFELPTTKAALADAKPYATGAASAVMSGLDQFQTGMSQTADWLLGRPLQAIGWENNPISAWNKKAQADQQQNINYFGEKTKDFSDTGKKAVEVGGQVVAALPNAVLALMTAGSSLAAQGTTAGLEAASAIGTAAPATTKLAGLARTVGDGITAMVKDPNYWLSFGQVAGDNYETAKADGADDLHATTYAVLNGLLNAEVEVGGGGIQTLPYQLKTGGAKGVKAWVDSMLAEGKEEVVQGVIERLLQNVAYGKGNPIYSNGFENGQGEKYAKEIGQYGKGNIDLTTRPKVDNGDGSYSTVDSFSNWDDRIQKEVLVPTVIQVNGKWEHVSEDEAWDYYLSTGEFLGKFDNSKDADKYAENLHEAQDYLYSNSQNAILNPVTSAKEFAGGAVVGGILGGGQMLANGEFKSKSGPVVNTETKRAAAVNPQDSTTRPTTAQEDAQGDMAVTTHYGTETPLSATQAVTEGNAAKTVDTILSGDVTNSKAESIISDPALRQAFEEKSGEKLTGTKSEMRGLVKDYAAALEAQREIAGKQGAETTEQVTEEAPRNSVKGAELPEGVGAKSNPYTNEQKVSEVYSNTYKNTDVISEKAKEALDESDYVFDSISEKESVAKAKQRLEVDFEGEVNDLSSRESYTAAEDVDTAFGILESYGKDGETSGDFSKVKEWSKDIYGKIHQSAVTLQAMDKYSRTPMGAVMKAQSVVEQAARQITTKTENGKEVKTAVGRQVEESTKNVTDGIKQDAKTVSQQMADDVSKAASRRGKGKSTGKNGGRGVDTVDHSLWSEQMGALLAENLEKRLESAKPTEPEPFTKTILSDLVKFAEEHALPNRPGNKIKRTAAQRIKDYFNNADFYAKSWKAAQEAIREKYADNPEALAKFDEWLYSTIAYNAEGSDAVMQRAILDTAIASDMDAKKMRDNTAIGNKDAVVNSIYNKLASEVKPEGGNATKLREAVERFVYENTVDSNLDTRLGSMINQAMREIGTKLSESVTQNSATRQDTAKKVVDILTEKYGVEAGAAKTVADTVTEKFNELLREKAAKRIGNMLKDTKGAKKKAAQSRLETLLNLSEFDLDGVTEVMRSMYGVPSLTTADVQKIYELSRLANNAADDYQKRMFENRAARVIANRMPTSTGNKIAGVRRIAMLLNPKTLVSRNAGGNAVFGLLEDLKDSLGTLIDKSVSKKTGQRTTSYNPVATMKAEYLGAKKGLTEWGKDIKNGVDTSPTQHEMPQAPTFEGKIGRSVEEALNKLLQVGDRPSFEAAKAKRLDELKRLGLDYWSEDAVGEATAYALERVFQNNSALAKRAMQMRDSLGVLGDIAIPFAQTPSNILDKLIDYSPYGYVRAIKKAGTVGDSAWSQKQFVDTLARSMTGTGLIAFGFAAAMNGLLTGGGDDGEDEGETYQNKVSGWQPYSVFVDGKSYTYDWATVGGILLGFGADMANMADGKADVLSILMNGTTMGINTLFNQSYLTGVSDLFGGDDIGKGIEDMLIGLPSSFTPTALQQIARIVDPVSRDTYDKNGFVRAWNKVKAKLPGLSMTLPAKIGADGKEMTNFQGGTLSNIFESVLSPGYINKQRSTAIDTEVQRLYANTKVTAALPNWSEYTSKSDLTFTTNKVEYEMSSAEWETYQKTRGRYTYKQLDTLFKSAAYKAMSDEEKVKAVSGIYDDATAEAKRKIIEGRGEMYLPTDGDVKKVDDYKAAGLSEDKAYSLYKAMDALVPETGKSEVSSQQKAKVVVQQGYGPKQTAALVGSLWNQSGAEEKKTLLPSLNVAQRLVTMYVSGGDSKLVSMTVPRSFSENNVAYTLTDAEMELFQTTYADYFNRNANNVMSEENLLRLREDAYNRAKYAVLRGRK